MLNFFQVALPLPFDGLFTYKGPSTLQEGDVVQVPFGARVLWGVIWEKGNSGIALSKIKTIFQVHPCLSMSLGLRRFLSFMAQYSLMPLGGVLKMALGALPYEALGGFSCPPDTQVQSYSFWKEHKKIRKETFLKELAQGLFKRCAPPDPLWSVKCPLDLNDEQKEALDVLKNAKNRISLLEGVTGSGKTEVLLSLCAHVWEKKQQVLVLLPEIILAHQWKERIERYFSVSISLWHSQLTPKARLAMFEQIMFFKSHVIIGARSALCLPYPDLGLIIVDEEHESGYKQTEGLLYHGRDMAVARGVKEGIPVVLASATPSLDSLYKVAEKSYDHVRLKKRYFGGQLPKVVCIPMASSGPKTWISPQLQAAIQETLTRGQQTLLFLNKRGYASLHLCYRCGYRSACTQCSAWLVVHKDKGLVCHHCGLKMPLPSSCPSCHDVKGLAMVGPGVERLTEEVEGLWPTARLALLSSDHMVNREEILKKISGGEIDIIIGTQILAKGHHFPLLTCLGIVDTDFALADMDFRASERLFQLLYQVMGRAGRQGIEGHVYVQTFLADHPLFKDFQSHDWHGFVAREMKRRQQEHLPPFTRMACLTLSSKNEIWVERQAWNLSKIRPQRNDILILGPAPAPINPLRGVYRWRFLIKTERNVSLEKGIKEWLVQAHAIKNLQVDFDRDPYSFF